MQYKVVTPPSTYPISLSEAKLHLRVSSTEEENRITALIKSATDWVEAYLRRQLITSTWDLFLDDFSDVIYIEKSPVTTLSTIKYYDGSNVLQTLSSSYYNADLDSEPSRVQEAYGYTWPTVYDRFNAVQIRFIAGYANAASVPDTIKDGIYLLITHLFDNRGDEARRVPRVIYDVLEPYRLYKF